MLGVFRCKNTTKIITTKILNNFFQLPKFQNRKALRVKIL